MVSTTCDGDTKRRKASFPVRLCAVLVSVAGLLWVAWSFWPPQIRVTRPTLDVTPDRIIATTTLTNRTFAPRAVAIRFDLGYQTIGADFAPSEFRLIASREVQAHIDARSTQTVTCEFGPPQKPVPFRADAQIVNQR